MENAEITNIKRLLHNVFEGAAWHGPSVSSVLEGIEASLAFKKFEKIHSIAELTYHMGIWKKFAAERLKGNNAFEITETNDWLSFAQTDDKNWAAIKNELFNNQKELVLALDKTSDLKLSELVHNKAYDYYTLLHGVIQHDAYHAGQISLLKK